MKPYIKAYSFEDEVMDYLTIIIGDIITNQSLDRVTLKIGKWPCAEYCPTDEDLNPKRGHNNLQGSCIVTLPIIKNMSTAFFEKLKMFAAHEAGHIEYTYPFPILNIAQKKAHDKRDWIELNVMNAFEDIRIEWEIDKVRRSSSSLTKLLPLSFKDFRKLAYGQLGTQKALSEDQSDEKKKFDRAYEIFGKLVLKSQLDLIGFGHLINDQEIREAYDTHFKSIIASNRYYKYNDPNWTLTITKEFIAKFKKVFPEEEKNLNEHQNKADENQGHKTQPGKGTPNKDGSSKRKTQGSSQEAGAGKEGDNSLENKSSYDVQEIGPVHGSEKEKQLNELLKGTAGGGGDVVITENTKNELSPLDITKTLREYGNAVASFNKLFCGGWRAPSHKIFSEEEEGEIDPEFLYKGKFGGRDRSIYQDSRKAIAEGLNVLCLFDNSGSMSSYQMQKVLDTSIIIDKACAIRNNIHARIVYFTNKAIAVRNYEDKAASFKNLSNLMREQGGTPTGDALIQELPRLLSRKGSKFLVVATDGCPDNSDKMKAALRRYREYGVKVLYIELGGGGHSFRDSVDYYLSYDSSKMKTMTVHLSRDIQSVIRDHARKSLKGIA
jgi:hypothetical protein